LQLTWILADAIVLSEPMTLSMEAIGRAMFEKRQADKKGKKDKKANKESKKRILPKFIERSEQEAVDIDLEDTIDPYRAKEIAEAWVRDNQNANTK
jgi:hypothetical protein